MRINGWALVEEDWKDECNLFDEENWLYSNYNTAGTLDKPNEYCNKWDGLPKAPKLRFFGGVEAFRYDSYFFANIKYLLKKRALTTNAEAWKTFTNLPPHSKIKLEYRFYSFYGPGPDWEADEGVDVVIDGDTKYSEDVTMGALSATTCRTRNNRIHDAEIEFYHISNNMLVKFSGNLGIVNAWEKSWGVKK